ncbi:unnamed protein product [Heligmosomoides polygyrus]|uniref:Protein Njmu-R1 n=1 Tax=Heligmosomoides polygyrus TaxID=6339 RepID=A0A183FDJ6_HELPZ|nr:unnamed protein product [Heligmosomoides polygyrus]
MSSVSSVRPEDSVSNVHDDSNRLQKMAENLTTRALQNEGDIKNTAGLRFSLRRECIEAEEAPFSKTLDFSGQVLSLLNLRGVVSGRGPVISAVYQKAEGEEAAGAGRAQALYFDLKQMQTVYRWNDKEQFTDGYLAFLATVCRLTGDGGLRNRVLGFITTIPDAQPLEDERFERMISQLERYGCCFTPWNFLTNIRVALEGHECTQAFRAQLGRLCKLLWDRYLNALMSCQSVQGAVVVPGVPAGENPLEEEKLAHLLLRLLANNLAPDSTLINMWSVF